MEHFKFGDSNGGVIISERPRLVAITTDLTKGIGSFPVVKIISYKKKGKIGDRIATVALYTASTENNLPNWIDFNPIPLNYATNDVTEIERALQSYSEKQWSSLERRLSQLQKPYQEGLFKVDLESSNWNATHLSMIKKREL